MKNSNKQVLLVGGCGYIGTYLYEKLIKSGLSVTICDDNRRGNPLGLEILNCDYQTLDKDFLSKFGVVLWFAGHSSVQQSINDPENAILNNCLNLFEFCKKLSRETKFIYASSASLYSTSETTPEPASESTLLNPSSNNPYDVSKFAFDYIATHFLESFYGIRMGTLAGYSPNLRKELVWNSMNISASKNGFLNLMNGNSWRTILFLDDLWCLINAIIMKDIEPGFINAGSITLRMHDLAEKISTVWDAKVINNGDSNTYSFALNLKKMHQICGASLIEHDFASLCKNFVNTYLKNGT